MKNKFAYFWFRRDLRVADNHGLYQALMSGYPVKPIFIFDTTILDRLNDKCDARLQFIHNQISNLKVIFNGKSSEFPNI